MTDNDDIASGGMNFIHEIKQIVTEARGKAYTAINSAMVEAYWLMGKRIVEEKQQGDSCKILIDIAYKYNLSLY